MVCKINSVPGLIDWQSNNSTSFGRKISLNSSELRETRKMSSENAQIAVIMVAQRA